MKTTVLKELDFIKRNGKEYIYFGKVYIVPSLRNTKLWIEYEVFITAFPDSLKKFVWRKSGKNTH
jgi:hypothetical protein